MTTYKIMTLNLKTDTFLTHGRNQFTSRASSIHELIRWNDPDFIGVQELTDSMIPKLGNLTEKYIFYGAPRNRKSTIANERCCIVYRKERFEFVTGSTFWLSATPDEPGSRIVGSAYPRIATIAVLKDKITSEVFTIVNTHLDHVLPSVRRKQAEVLIKEIRRRRQGSFIAVTGDFNTTLGSTALGTLVHYAEEKHLFDAVPITGGPTLRTPLPKIVHNGRPIDHIFFSDNVRLKKIEIITSMYMGTYPSDHFPVMAVFESPERTD